MPAFTTAPFPLVNNPTCRFLKLFIDGICHFDEFYESVKTDDNHLKSLDSIIARMDLFSPSLRLPKEKFRQIKGIGRNDVFEFKQKTIRIYVVKQEPDIYIVLGGLKNDQTPDIKWLKKNLKQF